MDKETAKKEIEKLVKDYEELRNQYGQTGYDEQQFCTHVLNKFFKALGWDVDNVENKSEYYCDVSLQYRLRSEESTKFPDYAFGYPAKTNPKFFVEAKTPSTTLKTEKGPAHQIRSYGRSAELARSILTNFEEFAIYDCSKKPKQSDNAGVGRIEYFTYKEYLEKFDFLWDTFSIDGVKKGRYDKYAQTDVKKKGSVPLDKEFVETLNKWRKYLATNIAQKNKRLTSDEVNYAVQQTIDRIIFLRFCEDRSIERFGTLKCAIQKGGYYKNLFDLFQGANKKYNSGLFDIEKDNLTCKISVDNSVIKNIIEELYRPKSEYEFGVMPLEILGNAYEEFLGKVIRVTPGRIVKINIDKKPEVQKAGGVFYTPQYIVNYIVENTVGKLIKGKTPNEISKIKIVDPACGSGSFLLGAYVYLLRYHTDYYWKEEYHKKIIKDNPLTRDGQLTVTEKKKILLNNIYGVDIDPNAVEVTKLSLLLKAMEGETEASVSQQLLLYRMGILPNLDDNIKCGNSLVGCDFETELLKIESDRKKKVNPFDWEAGFPNVFKQGKFDVVIGNPPYIQIQKLSSIYPEQTEYIKKYFETAKERNFDLYVVFIERGLKLLRKKGLLGYICPNRFFTSDYGKKVVDLIQNYNIYEIVNFRHYLVFENADTYTNLLFFSIEKQKDKIKYIEFQGFLKTNHLMANQGLINEANCGFVKKDEISSEAIKKHPVYLMTGIDQSVFNKLNKSKFRFSDLYKENFQGLITGNNDIYILKLIKKEKGYGDYYSKALLKNVKIENNSVLPILSDSDINNYQADDSGYYIIFPYDNTGKILVEKELSSKHPLAYKYLSIFRKDLMKRENNKFNDTYWYRYSRSQNTDKQKTSKLLIPHVVKKMRCAFDEKGNYAINNVGVNGIHLKEHLKISPYFIMAVLNSNVASFFISKISIFHSGGYYAANKQFASIIPFPSIDNKSEEHDEIVKCVTSLIQLKGCLPKAKLPEDRNSIENNISALENEINSKVYKLYGITMRSEIETIESNIK